jgi:predicted nuclease of restriction endonuclease-like (RecB) superfamily
MMETTEYEQLLSDIKLLVVKAKTHAIISVNQTLLLLYWQLGKRILATQSVKGWGAKVVESLSNDLRFTFPEMKGFSVRNLNYMRKFAEAYPDFSIVQTVSAQLSWSHHILLLDSFSAENLRLWYVLKAVEQGWSYRILQHQITQKAHEHFGVLPNNFKEILSEPQSELVVDLFKDEYVFDFIAQSETRKERELEKELVQHITDFLLSLGKGFSYVGRQYHLSVGGQDFYIDLLFYHFKIKCFVVIELKIDDFKPEYAGKLNFYLSVVDDLVKQPNDEPTIGLLLCPRKNDVVVEYALKDVHKPMGVATYQLTKEIPQALQNNLPTEAELKTILKDIQDLTILKKNNQ